MAHSKAGASKVGYDVFLSFSGCDTRYNFSAFLYRDLVNANVRTFKDEEGISVGDTISEKIKQAIDSSKIYMPVISRTYPDRKWCLIELERVMRNVLNAKSRKVIYPIFYEVEPRDIIRGTTHVKSLCHDVDPRALKEALAKIRKIKGWIVKKDRSQPDIVESVVHLVLKKLGRKQKSRTERFIRTENVTKSVEDYRSLEDERDIGGSTRNGGSRHISTAKREESCRIKRGGKSRGKRGESSDIKRRESNGNRGGTRNSGSRCSSTAEKGESSHIKRGGSSHIKGGSTRSGGSGSSSLRNGFVIFNKRKCKVRLKRIYRYGMGAMGAMEREESNQKREGEVEEEWEAEPRMLEEETLLCF